MPPPSPPGGLLQLQHTPHPAKVALERCSEVSASQEEILANSSFLGGHNGLPASDSSDEEVFATPPDGTTQQPQEDPVTVCTLPFTPTPSKPPAPPSDSDADQDEAPVNPRRKPRVCTRKVRGARIGTPTPSPEQQPQPEQQPIHVDPLVRAVLMIPARTTTATATTTSNAGKQDPLEDFIALARQRGFFPS